MTIIGLGTDLVHIPGFAEQLATPGTVFDQVFSVTELAQAAGRPGAVADHLAARWAGKEAVIKAWSSARSGLPPAVPPQQLDWALIEIVSDPWGRPAVRLAPQLAVVVSDSLASDPGGLTWQVSLTQDGDYAMATVVLASSQG